jgi:hypothetical protein
VIDLITVVFQQELFLIETQARSIELYIDSDKINNIYVAVNDEDSVAELIDTNWWGINSSKVKVIARSFWGNAHTLDGWSSQQLYKLLAANEAEANWAMCLDAKTWFVQKLDWDKLFSQDRVSLKSHKIAPVFQPARQFVEKYFGVDCPDVIGPGGVPFMFHVQTVKDMFSYIEHRENRSFFDFFVEHVYLPDAVTEFILYTGYVKFKHQSLSKLYTEQQYYSVTNLADWQMGNFDAIFAKMSLPNNLTASIQGRAYPHLTESQLHQWCEFLSNRQLVADIEKAQFRLNILR